MNSSRRRFLQSTGLGLLACGLPPSFLVRTAQAQSAKNKSLVVVFQRGAMDGLNVVVPFKDPAYYKLGRQKAFRPAHPLANRSLLGAR